LEAPPGALSVEKEAGKTVGAMQRLQKLTETSGFQAQEKVTKGNLMNPQENESLCLRID
jgi:hypothetical protein